MELTIVAVRMDWPMYRILELLEWAQGLKMKQGQAVMAVNVAGDRVRIIDWAGIVHDFRGYGEVWDTRAIANHFKKAVGCGVSMSQPNAKKVDERAKDAVEVEEAA